MPNLPISFVIRGSKRRGRPRVKVDSDFMDVDDAGVNAQQTALEADIATLQASFFPACPCMELAM
jgi:hypothetical protein